MRGDNTPIRGSTRFAAAEEQQECGRAPSQRRIRRGSAESLSPAYGPPEQKYVEAARQTTNLMRKGLLLQRAGDTVLESGDVTGSLVHYGDAFEAFKGISTSVAYNFARDVKRHVEKHTHGAVRVVADASEGIAYRFRLR